LKKAMIFVAVGIAKEEKEGGFGKFERRRLRES
jgi:hypothetical protein